MISHYYCLSVDRKIGMKTKFETAGKTATLFEVGVDYTVKTVERPFKYTLEDGTVLYLNLEQLRFMKSEYWESKKENGYLSKCIIDSDKNGFRRCRKDCTKCKWYMTGFTNGGIISLDALEEDYEYKIVEEDEPNVDIFKTDYAHERLHKAINTLKEDDKEFIMFKLKGMSDAEIAKELNVAQSTIFKKRNRIYAIIYEQIKDLKD